MNFAEFRLWREQQLAERPELLDCGQTNLYQTLDHLQPRAAASSAEVHRCDLARLWLSRTGFPESWSRQALISRGVRHALNLLFRCAPLRAVHWWMPQDVYPVYLELAQAAGIQPRLFPTLPGPQLPPAEVASGEELLLLPNPLKPLGRFLTPAECDTLLYWLRDVPGRRIVLDCAYDFSQDLHATTRRLWESDRAILLFTLSKGWLAPRTLGVALAPADSPAKLVAAFRDDAPTLQSLRLAQHCLTDKAELPLQIAAELDRRRVHLLQRLPAEVRTAFVLNPKEAAPGCYFYPVQADANALLVEHDILAIPAPAFGGPQHLSVLTSLQS